MEFLIGLFIGAFLGIVIMSFCKVASEADEEVYDKKNKEEK